MKGDRRANGFMAGRRSKMGGMYAVKTLMQKDTEVGKNVHV